jgi:hypothetical protein
MKFIIDKEWLLKRAAAEDKEEIAAGALHIDLLPAGSAAAGSESLVPAFGRLISLSADGPLRIWLALRGSRSQNSSRSSMSPSMYLDPAPFINSPPRLVCPKNECSSFRATRSSGTLVLGRKRSGSQRDLSPSRS